MIKIIIDWEYYKILQEKIYKILIIKRSYKGYCKWLENGEDEDTTPTPLSYDEYKRFEFWKIYLGFRLYFALYKGVNIEDFTLKQILFNKI